MEYLKEDADQKSVIAKINKIISWINKQPVSTYVDSGPGA